MSSDSPVTPAIWVIMWSSAMVGLTLGYDEACMAFLVGSLRYRELFFPATSKGWDAAELRRDHLMGNQVKAQISDKKLGIDWTVYCGQHNFLPYNLINIASTIAFFAAMPVAAWLCRYHGRRKGLLVGCCLILAGVLLTGLSWSIPQLVIGNIMSGAGRSINWLAILVEGAEVSPARQRGRFMCLSMFGYSVGFLLGLASLWEPHLQAASWGWRLAVLQNAWPAIATIVLMPFFIESPNSLIQRGRLSEGRDALVMLHGPFYNPDKDLLDILDSAAGGAVTAALCSQPSLNAQPAAMAVAEATVVLEDSHGSLTLLQQVRLLMRPQHLIPLLICCLLGGLCTSVHIQDIFVGPMLYGSLLDGELDDIYYEIMFIHCGGSVLAVLLLLATIDFVGRRRLLAFACTAAGCIWTALAELAAEGYSEASRSSTVPLITGRVLLSVLTCFNFLGPWAITHFLCTEFHSLAVRMMAAAFVLGTVSVTTMLQPMVVPYYFCKGHWKVFAALAAVCFLVATLALLLLPDSHQVPLEKMQLQWQRHWLWRRWLVRDQQSFTPRMGSDGR